jgi:DNA-directed RNA polymerase specialized sigma subunit
VAGGGVMTAKEYLGQIQTLIIGLKSLSRQVKSLEDALTGVSTQLSDTPGSATPNVRRMEELIAAKVDLERRLEANSTRLAAITNTINSLPDMVHTALLTARYIAGMEWQEIANELRISRSHLFNLHRDALNEIEKIILHWT